MEVFFYFSWTKSFKMRRLIIFLFISSSLSQAQYIVVLDSISNEPISYASVYDGKTGVITSASGMVYWSSPADSITLSCLGYASKKIAASQFRDTIYMVPKSVELLPVLVSNRKLTAEEIIDSVKANTKKNVAFGLSSSEVFVHSTYMEDTHKMDVKIEKSTITELDQSFVNELLEQVPKKEKMESFSRSKWLRDSGGLKHHKLEVLQAARLRDSLIENGYKSMAETVDEILKKRVKKDSYFKVKSGPLISVKVDNPTKEIDTVEQEKQALLPKDYAAKTLGLLQRLATKNLFEKNDWVLPFLVNPKKYTFSNEGIVYDLNVPLYKIRFRSNKKKDFSGYLLVDIDDYGVHKIEFQNNKHENRLKLFGLFFEKRLNNRTYTFAKNHDGKYTLFHIYEEYQQQIGLKRPIKIIEKNKVVKGRNRQNVLSMDVHFRVNETYQKSIYFNSFTPVSMKEFDAFTFKHSVLPKDLYSKAEIQKYIPGLHLE